MNSFHIIIYDDKWFLPYSLYYVDEEPITECIIVSVSPYICDYFHKIYMPIHRVCGFEKIG